MLATIDCFDRDIPNNDLDVEKGFHGWCLCFKKHQRVQCTVNKRSVMDKGQNDSPFHGIPSVRPILRLWS